MTDPGSAFLAESRRYLTDEYLPKIRAAVAPLDEADLWWRPNAASNSIANLLLHLAGNIRQWIVAGVGGAPDHRDRAAEFAARQGAGVDAVLAIFEDAVANAAAVLAEFPAARLAERVVVQGRHPTVLEAVYHVVEHCSMHAGQILWIVKARTGADLGFYRDADGLAIPQWPGAKPLAKD